MKKTKMRKKMLLSSIAMLMVATVSLGSATYAWFTNATTAKANALTLTANAAKGLQISTDGTTWGTNQTWATPANDTISPLSVPYTVSEAFPTTAFYAAKAGKDGAWSQDNVDAGVEYTFASKTLAAPAAYVNTDAYYLSYKVDVKLTGLADTDNTTKALSATIAAKDDTAASTGLREVVRIAIVDAATGNVTYGVYGDAAVKAITSTAPAVAENYSQVTTGAIACGDVSKTARTLYVYMWIEGQDPECLDTLMNLTGEYKITFSIPDFT